MNQHKNFTRTSLLQRFVISQIVLIGCVSFVIAMSTQQHTPKIKTDADKIASKKNIAGGVIRLPK